MVKDTINEYEETALLGMKHVRAFLNYEGNEPRYLHKAKVGAMAMSSYARLRATRANERALALVDQRQQLGSAEPRRLPAAVK